MRIRKKRSKPGIRRLRAARKSKFFVITPRAMMRVAGAVLAFLLLVGVFSLLFFNKKKYPASNVTLKVYDHRNDQVVVMDLEAYIVCVVAGEMPISYEPEALKAQAVAARTYAYRKIQQGSCGRSGADVCTDSGHCQAFSDLQSRKQRWGDNFDANEAKLEQAVYATAGIIMTYGGKPIDALYFSTSGGRTEDVENVYSEALPYLRGVESPGEEDAPRYQSTQSFKSADFIKTLKQANAKTGITVKNLAKNIKEPVRFPSGRVDTIKIGTATFTGKTISRLFSLGTTYFSIAVHAQDVIITTHGYGHGVGMSQVGANAMAKGNSTYDQILRHYYTGIALSPI